MTTTTSTRAQRREVFVRTVDELPTAAVAELLRAAIKMSLRVVPGGEQRSTLAAANRRPSKGH